MRNSMPIDVVEEELSNVVFPPEFEIASIRLLGGNDEDVVLEDVAYELTFVDGTRIAGVVFQEAMIHRLLSKREFYLIDSAWDLISIVQEITASSVAASVIGGMRIGNYWKKRALVTIKVNAVDLGGVSSDLKVAAAGRIENLMRILREG